MPHLIAAYAIAALAVLAYLVGLGLGFRRLEQRRASLRKLGADVDLTPSVQPPSGRRVAAMIEGATFLPWIMLALAPATIIASETEHKPYAAPPPNTDLANEVREERPARRPGKIGGLVVDGTHQESPLPHVEVVLRGVVDDVLTPLATTHTDQDGHFQFDQLEVAGGVLYVPGVNRDGIHYPGPRVGLFDEAPEARVRLVSYAGAVDASPLVIVRHDVEVRVVGQALLIQETALVMNPSLRGYAGADPAAEDTTTLELRPFPGFEKVTFHLESLGRQFQASEDRLTTRLAWPPGQREIKFSYQLPIESGELVLNRTTTLPTQSLKIRVEGLQDSQVQSNLGGTTRSSVEGRVDFASEGVPLPAGATLELRLTGLGLPWSSHLRWFAPATLMLLVAGSLYRLRRKVAVTAPAAEKKRLGLGLG